uniref:Uncharacterized protein n=1 Tax=Rhizophagus irregularis (strain DAOM 181602 / DAOM 197198 / MUCL 43194) TaxID=747089 RepID=U9URD1_RHIID
MHRYDDETASDDDSEDNPMVKSYQKNLDCIFQERRILNVPYVTSALPFVPKQFISKFFLGFFFALDRCQLLLGFGSVTSFWNWISAWAIKGTPSWTWISAWAIKVTPSRIWIPGL